MAIEMLPRSVGRILIRSLLGCLCAALGACQADPDGFTEQDREFIQLMALTGNPVDTSNDFVISGSVGAAELGQKLFFDPDLSGPLVASQDGQPAKLGAVGAAGRVACVDCHTPSGSFGDDRSSPNNVSLGLDYTSRNSPSLVNTAFYRWFAWDGRADSLWMQVGHAHESKKTMAGTRLRLAKLIAVRYPQYQELFDAGFSRLDPSDAGMDTEFERADGGLIPLDGGSSAYLNQVSATAYKALAAYISLLVSKNAPIDRYAAGDASALSPAAKRGLKLFLGRAGCVECHVGNTFTDNDFHSIGIGQRGLHVPASDEGRATGLRELLVNSLSVFNSLSPYNDGIAKPARDLIADGGAGLFRTKSLRNVANSPPYMHAGQLQSLQEVVRFYNSGGESTGFVGTRDPRVVPLGLTADEVEDLVAFLQALTGDPLPARLTCDPTPDAGSTAHRVGACL